MRKYYVEGVQKCKKAYLTRESKIAVWLYCSPGQIFPVQRTEVKEIENGVFVCYVTPHEAPNRHAHFLRETVIYYFSSFCINSKDCQF